MASFGPGNAKIRLIHFSDLHLSASGTNWRLADWGSKRLPGWFNLRCLGRGNRFVWAEKVACRLRLDWRARRPDHLVFSGDSSALGFREEIARAAELLGVATTDDPPALAVPGNHDYYTRSAAASGDFERCFAPWLQGERVNGATYPFARRVGPFWLVAVNSCTGNRWLWDSAGSVGSEQLARLQQLFYRLGQGPRILITHYPVSLANGRPEPRFRRLRDLDELLAICLRAGICLWLHGHRHTPFQLPPSKRTPFPIVCAGSATQSRRWSYGEYLLEPGRIQGVRRVYDLEGDRFLDGECFEFALPMVSF